MLSCLEEPCFGGVLPGTVLAASGSAFRLGGRGGGRGSVDGQLSDSSDLASFLSLASFFAFFFVLSLLCFLSFGAFTSTGLLLELRDERPSPVWMPSSKVSDFTSGDLLAELRGEFSPDRMASSKVLF